MSISHGFQPNLLISAPKTGQKAVAVTSTAIQLSSSSVPLLNGVIICNNGSANVFIGGSNVNTTTGGTGLGFVLAPGAMTSMAVADLNLIYINGTATTSWVSYIAS